MNVKQWITKFRKSARPRSKGSKTSIFTSPGFAQVAAVSLIVMLAVAAIVVIAHQATPSASAAPAAKPVAVSSTSATVTPPAKRVNGGKTKNGNAATSAQVSEVVTITGCLEEKNDTFRLKDTSGADAPKSRSWKTGFITKHASAVTVVDASNRMKLESHVGQRVSLTGTMADKEMQARTLQRVADACD